MKKINKIIPVVLGTGLTMVPAICTTSCSKQTHYEMYTYTFKDNESSSFEPKGRCSLSKANVEVAENQFWNDVKNDKKILADELIYTVINKCIWRGNGQRFDHIVGDITVGIGNINVKKKCLSFKIELNFKQDGKDYIGSFEAQDVQFEFYSMGNKFALSDLPIYATIMGLDVNFKRYYYLSKRSDWKIDIVLNSNLAYNYISYWSIPGLEWTGGTLDFHCDAKNCCDDVYVNAIQFIGKYGLDFSSTFWYMSEVEVLAE